DDNWADGLLQRSAEPDGPHGELPETFVGMSTALFPRHQDNAMEHFSPYTNDTHNPFHVAAEDGMSQEPRHGHYDPYGVSGAYENYGSFPGYSISPYETSYQATQNSNSFFPTPPLSTNVPNFFENTGYVPTQRGVQTPRRLQFGSDARFVGLNFVAPSEQETEESIMKRKMNHLECLKPEESPASTHPSSPVLPKKGRQISAYNADSQTSPLTSSNGKDLINTSTPDQKPRKRRKTGPDSDPDFEESQNKPPTRKPSHRTKPTTPKANTAPSRENSILASKSRPGSAKSNRAHLTEEQKKTNHIISEQKRRDLIAQGYEGIRQLVPALRDVKHSKGAMLESAADWLQDIVQTNEFLSAQLAAMRR
ncbi:MAG: hypothetical protein Q9191_007639, partial [Dirinaria sp. TL-2023a]